MTLGTRILQLLADSPGLSAEALADALGVPEGVIQRALNRSLSAFAARDWHHRWYLREQLEEGSASGPMVSRARKGLRVGQGSVPSDASTGVTPRPSAPGTDGERADLITVIDALLTAASEFGGAHSIEEAIQTDLAGLAASLGLSEALAAVPIKSVVQHPGFVQELVDEADGVIADLSDRDLFVFRQRVLSLNPPTLEVLGAELGVTRERARQLQQRATDKIDERLRPKIEPIGMVLRSGFGHVVRESVITGEVNRLFADESRPGTALVRGMMLLTLGYSVVEGIGMDQVALDVAADLAHGANEIADPVGLVDEDRLKQLLPDAAWRTHWDAMVQRAGLLRVLGHLALRETAKASVKAAIISLGRPASKEEIVSLIGAPQGRGGLLSGIPGIVRADKKRWGLEEWIDDVYEGIPAEIIQRITEDGGATTMARLVEELPRLFEVSETSVRMHVATPQFSLRDGYVSLADPSTIRYRNLDDVIDGRDEGGAPYWGFVVKERFLDGYSLIGFPPELARELGCGPNEKVTVPLLTPAGCRPLSVIWNTSSVSGATVGYLAEPIRRLCAAPGDQLHMVLVGNGTVGLRTPPPSEDRGGSERASVLLEHLKNRRKVL